MPFCGSVFLLFVCVFVGMWYVLLGFREIEDPKRSRMSEKKRLARREKKRKWRQRRLPKRHRDGNPDPERWMRLKDRTSKKNGVPSMRTSVSSIGRMRRKDIV